MSAMLATILAALAKETPALVFDIVEAVSRSEGKTEEEANAIWAEHKAKWHGKTYFDYTK